MIKNNLSNEFGLNLDNNEEIKENNTNQKPSYEVYEFSDNKNKNSDEKNLNSGIKDDFNENKEDINNNNHYCQIF